MAQKSVHVVITGRVQAVGFRAWVEDEAEARHLSGWVRNRRDGAVEAVFVGEASAVDAMVARCRDGPRAALVTGVETDAYAGPPMIGFAVLPTI